MIKGVVIGGSGGIGYSISKTLAMKCDKLVIHGASEQHLTTLAHELNCTTDVETIAYTFTEDFFFNNTNEKNKLINIIKDADVLFICYGPFLQKPIDKMTEKEWITMSNLVFGLPGFLVSVVLPSMLMKQYGRIVLFGGTRTDTITGYRTNAAYGAAKTAICSLVKSIAMEYGNKGITCNAILPGFVDSDNLSDIQRKHYQQLMNSDKLVSTEAITKASMFLIDNPDINGALLRIDNGWLP